MTSNETRVPRGRKVCGALVSSAAFVIIGACTGTSTAQPAAASTPARATAKNPPMSGALFCAKLQPLVQPLVKPALALFKASDATTNDLQAGDAAYVECDFRPPSAQVDVSLHDDSDRRFDDASAKGYAALPGFAGKARYTTKAAAGMRWVDVVRGTIACEARVTLDDAQFNGDWKQATATICEAAFSVR
jgi:hypothetical protein